MLLLNKQNYRTSAELLVDEASDLIQLVEVGGLQEWEEVSHIGLLPGHGGGSAGGGGSVSFTVSVPACLEDSWGHPPIQSPGTSTTRSDS